MIPKTVFVDFDSTLFDTQKFMRVLWSAIGEKYGVDYEQALSELRSWYSHGENNLGFYRVEDHVKAVTGHDARQVVAALDPKLRQYDFAYSDAGEILTWHKHSVRILTYGEDWFQNLKLGFVPQFNHVPRDIILQEKGAYITGHFPGVQGWLIDDRRGAKLPPGVTEVWLNRQASLSIAKDGGMIILSSLKQATQFL